MPSTDCFHGQLNDPGFRLKEGDIILEIDGQPLTRATGVSDMVRGMEGTYVELKVKPQHENSRHLEPYKTKIMRRPNPILHALRFLSLLDVPDVEFLDGGDCHAASCIQVQLMKRCMHLNGVCAAPGRSCASRSSFMTSLWLTQRRATATLPSDTAIASKENDVQYVLKGPSATETLIVYSLNTIAQSFCSSFGNAPTTHLRLTLRLR